MKNPITLPIAKFSTLDTGRIRCLFCDKTFGQMSDAKRHFNEIHVIQDQTFACYLCQKTFTIKRRLTMHLLSSHKISQKMLKTSTN